MYKHLSDDKVHLECAFAVKCITKRLGARCSSVERELAYGAMGRGVDLRGVEPLSYFSF